MNKRAKKRVGKESDDAYFLKILIYFVLGTIWLKYNGYVIFPVGMLLGIVVAQKDHFSIDRRIEYAIVLVAAVIGLIGLGLYLVI